MPMICTRRSTNLEGRCGQDPRLPTAADGIFMSGNKWSPAGETFYADNSSNAYYLAAMDSAQIALRHTQQQAPYWSPLNLSYPPATPEEEQEFRRLMRAIGTGLGNAAAHEIGHHLEIVTPGGDPGFPYMDCGVHNPEKSGANACENDDDFVFNFWKAGYPQDPIDLSYNRGQFFFVDVPGHHSIQWCPKSVGWLTKYIPRRW